MPVPRCDSVVATVVRLEAFTIKWAFCFLPAVAARVMILVWGCCYTLECICFLCDAIMVFMSGMHEKLSFSVCLLKILFNGWFLRKHLSTMDKNVCTIDNS